MTAPCGFAADLFQPARVFDRLVPILFVLIDADQVLERGRRLRIHRDQIGEQGFGAIEQARAHVILAQFKQGDGFLVLVEIRARDQVLMHADRAIDLAAAAEQIAEREMRFDRIAIDVGELEEDFDRLVLLLVEQVIEAPEITGRQLVDACARGALAATTTQHPAGKRGDRQQEEQQREYVVHASPCVGADDGGAAPAWLRLAARRSRRIRGI